MGKVKTNSKQKAKKETPLMAQYNSIKRKYPDAILLFRVGDFYETFGKDAITVSGVLGITLTKRANGSASHIELAGFPHHSLDTYLPKLVRAGYRAAICDQLEDASKTKKIVKRGVTELVTPGLALSDKLLDHKKNNYLASVYFGAKEMGISCVDISTGEFIVAQGGEEYIGKLLQSFNPSEVIFQSDKKNRFEDLYGEKLYTYQLPDWVYQYDYAMETLLEHFNTKSLKGFGVSELNEGLTAAGAVIHYLGDTEHSKLQHITSISRMLEDKYVWLDRFSIRNLELLYSNHETGVPLIDILDRTNTAMGARLLKKWTVLPLKNKKSIQQRLDLVEYFLNEEELAEKFDDQIKRIGDLERLIAKVPLGRVNPRQLIQLKNSLLALEPIKQLGLNSKSTLLSKVCDQLNPCKGLTDLIESQIEDDPPVDLKKGDVIKPGVNAELDEFRELSRNAKGFLDQIKKREVEKTGITSLKIGFNNVFGYYLEVTNRFKDKVPEEWIRKQTLTSAERYITEELKKYEYKILQAGERIDALQAELFETLVGEVFEYIRPVQLNASLIAKLDCLLSFSKVSDHNKYCKPEINDGFGIDIKSGRHPVIETQLKLGDSYIPNDLYLDSETQQIVIITGPNMSGKSAILRQTALITLMAQMGCFVPAKSATLGIVDKVFTRVGASDNISSGESTFMVEMNETASIMNNLSERSLILLDEIGRGTSTYDGISIAWALTEYLHNNGKTKAKTLFATHYHELIELGQKLERCENYNVTTKEIKDKVLFLRKLEKGGCKHSFGIHVASMAGMPREIVLRASEILKELESQHINSETKEILEQMPIAGNMQMNLFSLDDPKLAELRKLLDGVDINSMTPVEALLKLSEMKKMIE